MRALCFVVALTAVGCGPKYPDGPPTITETGIAKGRTFLFRRVQVLHVGPETTTDTFVAEETLAEGSGNVVTAVKLHVLDESSKQESGDVTQTLAWAAGEDLIVRARGEGVEMWTLPEKAGVRSEVEAIVAAMYWNLGKDDPFLANVPRRRLVPRAKVPELERAIGAYLLGGKDGPFQSFEEPRAFVIGVRDEVVTVHIDVTMLHSDKECSYRATLRGDVTVRRHGGDLAHLEVKGPLAGTCDGAKTAGDYALTVDRSPR